MLKTFTTLLLLTLLNISLIGGGFLKRSGKDIVDGNNENFVIRAMGLGGWLVPEGYMWQSSAKANSPTEIKNEVIDLIGEPDAEIFYEAYRANYVNRKDIAALKNWGFNAVRLPMHYELLEERDSPGTYIEEGFIQIDSLLRWCEDYEMYLILDLHCAAGGQSDEPISDYDASRPSLWEDENNRIRTVNLWRKIAERYADKEWIGGYDLINEPKWELGPDNALLKELYVNITNAIREVDTNHIVYIEGNWFATVFDGLLDPWDENMCYSFHKYWNATDVGTINYLLSIRNNTNIPLWLGESGENSNAWFTETITLMEENNIGWSWWPHKKVGSIAGPLSAIKSSSYQYIVDYWNGQNSKPGQAFAKEGLMSMAESLKIENCRFQPDVIDAMFRAVESSETVPYKELELPGSIWAVDYDIGRYLSAYSDKDYKNTGGNGGSYNTGWSYRNDGVDIERCSDVFTNGYSVGWIDNGEWLKYTVDVKQSGYYGAEFRFASANGGGRIIPSADGNILGGMLKLPSTGGWYNWQSAVTDSFHLSAGETTIMLQFISAGFNLNYINFELLSVTDLEDDQFAPDEFSVSENYPNPFNPQTTIYVNIPEAEEFTLEVYNSVGQKVGEAFRNRKLEGGNKLSLNFNSLANDLSSGVYYFRLYSETYSHNGKLIYLK